MADDVIPLVHRGAEALEALLNYDTDRARENVRLLTFSELLYLAAAAGELSALATAVREETWPMPGPRLQGIMAAAEQPEPVSHKPGCACGYNDAGHRFIDLICRRP